MPLQLPSAKHHYIYIFVVTPLHWVCSDVLPVCSCNITSKKSWFWFKELGYASRFSSVSRSLISTFPFSASSWVHVRRAAGILCLDLWHNSCTWTAHRVPPHCGMSSQFPVAPPLWYQAMSDEWLEPVQSILGFLGGSVCLVRAELLRPSNFISVLLNQEISQYSPPWRHLRHL